MELRQSIYRKGNFFCTKEFLKEKEFKKNVELKKYINDIQSRMLQYAYDGCGKIALYKRDMPQNVDYDYIIDYFKKKGFLVFADTSSFSIYWFDF